MSDKIKKWLWLFLVIISETSATSTLKMFDNSEGTTKTLLLVGIVALYIVCYYSLAKAVTYLPVGVAYATWSGIGILIVTTLGMVFYDQQPNLITVLSMLLIGVGIIVMNLFSKMGEE